MRAATINQSNIEDIRFPDEINAEDAKKYGSAQSIIPSSFLVNKGAESEFFLLLLVFKFWTIFFSYV